MTKGSFKRIVVEKSESMGGCNQSYPEKEKEMSCGNAYANRNIIIIIVNETQKKRGSDRGCLKRDRAGFSTFVFSPLCY